MDSLGLWPPSSVDAAPAPANTPNASPDPGRWNLPRSVEAALWKADHLSRPLQGCCPTGFDALNQELPGGGWPTHGLTEILQQAPPAGQPLAEWRLLLPAMRHRVRPGQPLVLIAPPWPPHAPGLQQAGVDTRQLVWIQAQSMQERLWATEQLLKGPGTTGGLGSLIAWLPQAQAPQIRRLQTWALRCDAPVFLVRPARVRDDASAAPLRVLVSLPEAGALPGSLHVHVLKRRGPVHEGVLTLDAWPAGLEAWARHKQAVAAKPPVLQSPLSPTLPVPEAGHAVAVADPHAH